MQLDDTAHANRSGMAADMSSATRSIQVWSAYTLVMGVTLLLIPNVLLGLVGIAETNDVWVRVAGVPVLVLAVYYWFIARDRSNAMYRATVYGRWLAAILILSLGLTTGPWQFALFAAADAVAATWTHLANRPGTV